MLARTRAALDCWAELGKSACLGGQGVTRPRDEEEDSEEEVEGEASKKRRAATE